MGDTGIEVLPGRWAFSVRDAARMGILFVYEDTECGMHECLIDERLIVLGGRPKFEARLWEWRAAMVGLEFRLETARVQTARLAADALNHRTMDMWGSQ